MINEMILKEFYAVEKMGAKPTRLNLGQNIHKALTSEMCASANIPDEACVLTMFRGVMIEKDDSMGPDNFSVMWHK